MIIPVPNGPHFNSDGTPTIELREFFANALAVKSSTAASEFDFAEIEALIAANQIEIDKKQSLIFEDHYLQDNRPSHQINHKLGTDRISISIFKDTGDIARLHRVRTTNTRIILFFAPALNGPAANALVRIWALGK